MRRLLPLILVVLAASIAGCGEKETPDPSAPTETAETTQTPAGPTESPSSDELPDDVAAWVAGKEISVETVEAMVERALEAEAPAGVEVPPAEDLRRMFAEQLVRREVLFEEARRRGVQIDERGALEQVKDSFPTEQAYRDFLSERGISEEELTKETVYGETFSRLGEELLPEVAVSQADVESFKKRLPAAVELSDAEVERQLAGQRRGDAVNRLIDELLEAKSSQIVYAPRYQP